MDFNNYFHAFLTSTVNLKPSKLELLEQRVTSIVNAFQADDDGRDLYVGHTPQGSWAHRTIIEPVDDNDEFDADFLLRLDWVPEWEDDPRTYLKAVEGVFNRHGTYAPKLTRKNRCVRIQYAGSCHVDVVPAVTLPGGDEAIVNYQENVFEDTNPSGFAQWMRERDELSRGHLRLVIRLLKWLRDYKNTFSCPSIILTVLLGNQVGFDGDSRYTDVPSALVALLEDLDFWLSAWGTMPPVGDPSCPGTDFTHRWDDDQYQTFRRKISDYAGWARDAYDLQTTDPTASVLAWQKLFGPEFASQEVKEASLAAMAKRAVATHSSTVAERAPDEQFIHEQARVAIQFPARLEGTIVGARRRNLRKAGAVAKGHDLQFELTTNTPPPYEVLWKVRNRGPEAAGLGQLRGSIFRDAIHGSNRHQERTKYAGEHYVEVYVLKDGVVVASDHLPVRILR